MTPIQQTARQAIADARAQLPEHPSPVIYAIKLTRDRAGSTLPEARAAVNWALEHPHAADLPVHSIVGSAHAAWYKEQPSPRSHTPWASTGSERYHDDTEIDVMLEHGEATILRVGTGA